MFMAEEYHNGYYWDEMSEDYMAGYVAGTQNLVWSDKDWDYIKVGFCEYVWYQLEEDSE